MATAAQVPETGKTEDKVLVIREYGEVVKNQTTKILVRVLELKGRRFVDLRLMDLSGKKWLFSKKGLTLNRKTFPEVAAILSNNQEEIEELLNPIEITDP